MEFSCLYCSECANCALDDGSAHPVGPCEQAGEGRTGIVIVEVANEEQDSQVMGVVVDAVNAVLEIPSSEIEPPPAFGAKIRTDFIEGLAKVDGKFVILLDVNQVLSIEDVGALAQLVEHQPQPSAA